MNAPLHPYTKLGFILAILLVLGIGARRVFWRSPVQAAAPSALGQAGAAEASSLAGAIIAPISATTASAPAATNTQAEAPGVAGSATPATTPPGAPAVPAAQTAQPDAAAPSPPSGGPPQPQPGDPSTPDEIQLSFQGANIDMIVQWLAKTTGKSVIKHPRVQCQLTIVSSKKLALREAIDVVYRALALEGFNTIESSNSIFIVPEGQEPKISPELLGSSSDTIPEGRQRLIKVFPLQHSQPAELKEKVRPVLSEKATLEVDDRARQLIATDYNENLRLLADLIKALDVASASDSVIEIFSLKHSEADELSNLLGLILNAQTASPSRPSSSPSSGPMPGSGPPSSGGPSPGASAPGGAPPGTLQVRIWPDKTANRLIVAAPKSKLSEVEQLIGILDVDKPQDVAVRVLPLKHVSAEDLVKEIGPLYQKMGGKSVKETIEVTANNRSNSLIVLASEANFLGIEKLVAALDTDEAQEKVMQAFPLKNADAEDVAKQLQQLSEEQQSASRYFYYSYPPARGSGKKMSVVADRRRNTVVVQAPPGSMESIAKMIRELDEPVSDNSLAPKIIPLKFVSAVDIEDVLNELFLKKQQQRNYWFYDDFSQETPVRDVGRLYGKVRITSEPYSNSIIITSNSPENLAAVEEVLKQLDVPSQAGETTLRVGLKFAEAVKVASSMNILFAKGGSPPLRPAPQPGQPAEGRNQQQPSSTYRSGFELEKEISEEAYYPWLGGQPETYRSSDGRSSVRPVSDLVGRARLVPDRRSNSLLITANVHLLPQVLKLINELDAPTAQVLIEAKIIEVASDFRDRLGVRWSPDGTRTFDPEDMDNSLKIRTGTAYREVFAGSVMADALRSGVLDTSVSLDFLIQFLRKTTGSKVLAEPQINIADNELGRLFVGAQVPFIERSLSTDVGGLNQTFSYKDVGVILEVTPHINNSEDVALKIRAESSNIRSGETLFGGAILDTRNFRTDLMVKSGQTVVLGGIIQQERVNTVRKVPFLGDIPGLGWAFKKKDTLSREIELIVFLRPRVTRTPEQVKELLDDVERHAPHIRQWKDQLELENRPPDADGAMAQPGRL